MYCDLFANKGRKPGKNSADSSLQDTFLISEESWTSYKGLTENYVELEISVVCLW